MSWWHFAKRRRAWAQCQTCGFDVPEDKIRLHKRYGWQCTGAPGANCWDGGPHRDEQFAAINFREGEGIRKTPAPVTNTVDEGV